MEILPAYAPSPFAVRREAVALYIRSEDAMDAGRTVDGVASMRAAIRLAWELETEQWPAWATALYDELKSGNAKPPPLPPPPLIWESSAGSKSRYHCAGSAAACAALPDDQFCAIVDGFAGQGVATDLRAACEAAWTAGRLFEPAKVGSAAASGSSGGGSTDGRRDAVLTRSDFLAWVDDGPGGAEDGWTSLSEVARRVDALVEGLRERMLGADAIVTRHKPQVARYGENDAYARHCDNHCPTSGVGPHCNGRWLTAIYYASQPSWQPADGGCLRLFMPQGSSPQPGAASSLGTKYGGRSDNGIGGPCDATQTTPQQPQQQQDSVNTDDEFVTHYEDDARLDIAPLADRLFLFWSDFRCPHAVLPVTSSEHARYAATFWYTVVDGSTNMRRKG